MDGITSSHVQCHAQLLNQIWWCYHTLAIVTSRTIKTSSALDIVKLMSIFNYTHSTPLSVIVAIALCFPTLFSSFRSMNRFPVVKKFLRVSVCYRSCEKVMNISYPCHKSHTDARDSRSIVSLVTFFSIRSLRFHFFRLFFYLFYISHNKFYVFELLNLSWCIKPMTIFFSFCVLAFNRQKNKISHKFCNQFLCVAGFWVCFKWSKEQECWKKKII